MAKANNVWEYYIATLCKKTLVTDDGAGSDWREFTMDTHCGKECKKIVDKAAELLKMCDPHPDVVKPIQKGVLTAIEIICFG